MARSVPERARAHILANPDQRPLAAAAALGLSVQTIRIYRSWLIAEGALRPQRVGRPRQHTDDLVDAIEQGQSVFVLARAHGVDASAIHSLLSRRGLRVSDIRDGRVFSALALTRALGYPDGSQVVVRRFQAAGLRVRRNAAPRQRRVSRYLIAWDDVIEFAATDAGRRLIDLARVADPDLAEAIADRRRPDYRPPTPIDGNEVRRLRGAAD